jgi:glucose/arabinose dehydrogenase
LENRQTVVSGLPAGGHSTRTLAFDELGRLYISIGSASNLDATSARARIVRYNDFATATFPLVYPSGSSVFGTNSP